MTLWTPTTEPTPTALWSPGGTPRPSSPSTESFRAHEQQQEQQEQQQPYHYYHHRRHSSGTAGGASQPPPQRIRQDPVRRVAQIVRLRPECVAQYKECHARVWPEVLLQIKESNIEDYSIFHDDLSHTLFASFRYIGSDYAGDMEKMRQNEKVREWWRMTDSYQKSYVPGAKDSESGEPAWWKGLEEVFYLA
ncbi:MAG: hypothetical protein M1818_008302 [Claussenomyces sp. TS43310]|nr:MAG: hypothetical protein M1818_008302 [Claussenomyces sp. TS43310]